MGQLNLQTFMVITLEEKQELHKITIMRNQNLNTFISVFPSNKPKYALLVMLENPQIAKNLIYNYKGMKIKGLEMKPAGILYMLLAK